MIKPLNESSIKKMLDVIEYDPDTGLFRWKKRPSARCAEGWFSGGCLGKKGYLGFRVFYERYYAHRLAWALHSGSLSESVEIDHINGNKADNRIINLRVASPSQNQHNKNKYLNNKSGLKGICLDARSGKWRAKFNCDGVRYELGLFEMIEEAKTALIAARSKAHGDFANNGAES